MQAGTSHNLHRQMERAALRLLAAILIAGPAALLWGQAGEEEFTAKAAQCIESPGWRNAGRLSSVDRGPAP
jgi:hypothetical protein